MRRQTELLGSRARVKDRYALIPLEGIPLSVLPEWPNARVQVLAAPALGAEFAEYRIEVDAGTVAAHPADGEIEHFLFVLSGEVELGLESGAAEGGSPGAAAAAPSAAAPTDDAGARNAAAAYSLSDGGYALVPPSTGYHLRATTASTLLLLRKRYEPPTAADGAASQTPAADRHPRAGAEFEPVIGHEAQVKGEVYMGDEGALLQSLIPADLSYDLAMNIFTFETGHSLPVTETHVMEHGLYVLAGKGLYYLDDTWMEVEATDFIWMGPFCPQSYYATGPTPTRYIYYKNINRDVAL